ncbi:hypothetical protein L1049_022936 [Liquidambar formosana]|uniref:Uncharacterized protein n=1 Tax=Liquidambar formosana TaxID=63359 RepID=A0AAP0RDS6_LIQFO
MGTGLCALLHIGIVFHSKERWVVSPVFRFHGDPSTSNVLRIKVVGVPIPHAHAKMALLALSNKESSSVLPCD